MFSMKKQLHVILAATALGEIGINNTIPWKLKGDLPRFKRITRHQVVVMGRKTLLSLPESALLDRSLIVVSEKWASTGVKKMGDTFVASNLRQALEIAETLNGLDGFCDEVYVAGGVRLYEQALRLPCILRLTLVHKISPNGYDAKIKNFNVLNFNLAESPLTIHDVDEVTGLPVPSHSYVSYQSKPETDWKALND